MSREMKDSGIPWIGEIPKYWTIELIGNQVKEVDNPNTNGEECNALQFKMGTIISKSKGDSKYNPETLEGYNIVDKGVIMLNGLNLSFDFISQRVGLVKERGVITSTYLAVKPTPNIDSEFLTYLFKAYDNCKAFHSMGRGLRQTLSYGELRKYLLVYPPLSEQQRIAELLDRKCVEVDEVIALQEQIIEELKAYKQSVITEAVTKGLNPATPMRDSGIDWIGFIPEHWEVKRLKQESTFINGFAFDSEDFKIDEGIKVIRIGDIGLQVDFENCVRATTDASLLSSYRIADGDILIAMSGATTGKCCIVERAEEAYINQRVGIIRSDVRKLIYYSLLTPYFMEFVNLNNAGSAQPNISSKAIGEFPIIIMPPTEQRAIADYLDEKCADIDSLIQTKQSKIDSLKEYKKSIIYEYVTGKREVE